MPLIEWSDARHTLGLATMDDTHRQFVALVNRIETLSNTEFPALFAQLFEHTEQHFAQENALMDETRFPASAEHKAEHQRVLGELTQLKKRIDKGSTSLGKAYVRDRLPDWFALHAATMDSALAAHVLNRVG